MTIRPMTSEETALSLACDSTRRLRITLLKWVLKSGFEPIGWIGYRNGILKRLLKPVLETAFQICFLKQQSKRSTESHSETSNREFFRPPGGPTQVARPPQDPQSNV